MYYRQKGRAEIGGVFGCIGMPAVWDGLVVMLQRTLSFELPMYGSSSWGTQMLHLHKKALVRAVLGLVSCGGTLVPGQSGVVARPCRWACRSA